MTLTYKTMTKNILLYLIIIKLQKTYLMQRQKRISR